VAQSINLNLNITIPGGPTIAASESLEVEAYDFIKVTVKGTDEGADTNKEVEVLPGVTGQVTFLAITSDKYDSTLTYSSGEPNGLSIELDQPQVFAGAGAVGLLDPPPTKLFFTNNLSENAEVQILVGRDATPSS
jgi:hypothetical protein